MDKKYSNSKTKCLSEKNENLLENDQVKLSGKSKKKLNKQIVSNYDRNNFISGSGNMNNFNQKIWKKKFFDESENEGSIISIRKINFTKNNQPSSNKSSHSKKSFNSNHQKEIEHNEQFSQNSHDINISKEQNIQNSFLRKRVSRPFKNRQNFLIQNPLQPCTSKQALITRYSPLPSLNESQNSKNSDKNRLNFYNQERSEKSRKSSISHIKKNTSDDQPSTSHTSGETDSTEDLSSVQNSSDFLRQQKRNTIAAQLSRRANNLFERNNYPFLSRNTTRRPDIIGNFNDSPHTNHETHRFSLSNIFSQTPVISAIRRTSYTPTIHLTRMFEDFRMMQLISTMSNEKNGADKSTIKLNTNAYKYNKKEKKIKTDSKDNCVICLVDYENEDDIRCLPCMHSFHLECIDEWLAINKKCPVCRVDIESKKSFT